MDKRNSFLKKLGAILLGVLVLLLAMAVVFRIYARKYYRSDTAIIDAIAEETAGSVNYYYDERTAVFFPVKVNPKAVIVFYPGGKVEFTAYNSLMYKLAEKGYICVTLKMPENLAFFNVDAATSLFREEQERFTMVEDLDWYIAGHSLGGAIAASYFDDVLSGKTDLYHDRGPQGEFSGIILCASYSTKDLSDDETRLLSIYGSDDSVLSMDSYDKCIANWPEDATEYVIQGGNHSYFGSYGVQDGDSEGSITNEEQLDKTAEVIDEWISAG